MSMPSWKEMLIILLIVLVIFGAKKLKALGSDLGGAIRGFRSAASKGDEPPDSAGKSAQSVSRDSTSGNG